MVVDSESPTVSVSTPNGTIPRLNLNQSVLVLSPSIPLRFQCSDSDSGIADLNLLFENTSINSTGDALNFTSMDYKNLTTSNQTQIAQITCTDNVGNIRNQNVSIILDEQPPILSVSEQGSKIGHCVGGNWKLTPSATDYHTTFSDPDICLAIMDKTPLSRLAQPPTVQTSPKFLLRAADEAGLVSGSRSWNVSVDTTSPSIQTASNSSGLTITTSDNCGVNRTEVQWETYSGQRSGWSTYTQN